MATARHQLHIDKELDQRLSEAVKKGDVHKVRSLLRKFSKDEARDILNRSSSDIAAPLIEAIRHKHEKLVRVIVDEYDVRVDGRHIAPGEAADDDTVGDSTPVLESLVSDSLEILEIICRKLHDINKEYPVLHLACKRITLKTKKKLLILLRSGADANARDREDLTPLMVACQESNPDAVKILLQHGANVNISTSDGNTAFHYLIDQRADIQRSAHQTLLLIAKEMLQYDVELKLNNRGLTPLWLACLKRNESMVELFLSNLSLNDRQRADCYELLASSCLLRSDVKYVVPPMKKHLGKSYDFLIKAMILRHSQSPPLWKCQEEKWMEAFLDRLETQTLQELATIRTNVDALIVEAILVRQRILDRCLYNDYLFRSIEYLIYRRIEHLKKNQIHQTNPNNCIALFVYLFKLLQLVDPSSEMLKEKIGYFNYICEEFEKYEIFHLCNLGSILEAMEEFRKCERSDEGFYMTDVVYVILLDTLHLKAYLRNGENVQTLTKRFIRLTKDSIISAPHLDYNEIVNGTPRGRGHGLPNTRWTVGDSELHIACRELPYLSAWKDVSGIKSESLARFLKILHACGSDVNARNADGQTPLQVLLCRFRSISSGVDFNLAVRSLLMAGANPNLKNKHGTTSLHCSLTGYPCFLHSLWPSVFVRDFDLKEWNTIVELLLKSGAKPTARNSEGFSPLHHLMKEVVRTNAGYVTERGDQFAYHRKMFHEVVRTIQKYGGCAHAITNDGRTVFDMCNDEDLLEKMKQDIKVTCVSLTLSQLAAAAIRKHQVQYHDKLPTRLIKFVELCD